MNLEFTDVISQCDDGKHRIREPLATIDTIAVHRIGKSLGEDAITICRRFIDDPEVAKYTGGEVPYGFILGAGGTIWQCLPISEVGAHARRWNKQAIGVACIGDFREHMMPPFQYKRLIHLLACLQFGFPRDLEIKGHDELPGASSDPNKKCPGDKLPMQQVRDAVRTYLDGDHLREIGIVI